MNDAPGLGHNLPSEPSVIERAADLVGNANRWISERPAIMNEDQAGIAQAFLDQLRACRDDLEAAQKEERRPPDEAIGAIRARFLDPLSKIGIAIDAMRQKSGEWLKKKQAAAEAAKAAEKQAAKPVERAQVKSDYSVRAQSLRVYWHARVTDESEALRSYAKKSEVRPRGTRRRAARGHEACPQGEARGRRAEGLRVFHQRERIMSDTSRALTIRGKAARSRRALLRWRAATRHRASVRRQSGPRQRSVQSASARRDRSGAGARDPARPRGSSRMTIEEANQWHARA
jgi:hypothetical protein